MNIGRIVMTIKLKVEFLKPKKSKEEIEKERKAERMRIKNERKAKAKLSREQRAAWRKIKKDYVK